MKKILFIIYIVFLAYNANATTYYISTSGSDTGNNGTSTGASWEHAPGMTGCVSNCASKTPSPGDKFILRGGDTWYPSGAGAHVGLPWSITWSGTAGNNIYFGVDKTWYAGGSWIRPKLNGGNTLSATTVASCSYQTGADNVFLYSQYNNVTVDNIEFLGLCWDGATAYADDLYINMYGATNNIFQNLYLHGWTHTAYNPTTDAAEGILGTTQTVATGNTISALTCDGSDADGHSMNCIWGDVGDVEHSTFRYATNGFIGNNCQSVHDNLFEYMSGTSFDPTMHTNNFECNNSIPANQYYYNNLIRHSTTAVTAWTCARPGYVNYVYNNVIYDVLQQGWDIAHSDGTCQAGGTHSFFNNTFVGVGVAVGDSTTAWTGTLINNLWIDGATTVGTGTITETYKATLTVGQATTQGLVAASNYTPTSASVAVIGLGSNLSAYFTIDYNGNTRTVPWDIGAIGYNLGGTTYTVTPTQGSGCTMSPSTPQIIASGATTTFTVTGPGLSMSGTCGGSLAGSTYTTNAITANCTVISTCSGGSPSGTPTTQVLGVGAPFKIGIGSTFTIH